MIYLCPVWNVFYSIGGRIQGLDVIVGARGPCLIVGKDFLWLGVLKDSVIVCEHMRCIEGYALLLTWLKINYCLKGQGEKIEKDNPVSF